VAPRVPKTVPGGPPAPGRAAEQRPV